MKKIILLSGMMAIVSSCNLDRMPFGSVESNELLSNPNSVSTVTNGNYALLKGDANGGGFYNNLYRVVEYGGDNVTLSGTTTDSFFFMYNYNRIKNNSRDANIWSNGYRAIIGCNKVLETAQEGVDDLTNQLIGENYFLRAYTYFQLVNVFGKPYYQGRQNLGVPLKTSTSVTDLPPRATVGEIYDLIVADLLKAEKLMTNNSSRVRATRIAAQGLLSRVYLYMGLNTEAKTYADKVIQSGTRSLVPNSEFADYVKKRPEDNTETIFAFKYNRDGDYNHGWYTIGSMFANIQNAGWGEMYASQTYLDLLEENPNDVRMSFIQPVYATNDTGQKVPAIYWVDTYQSKDPDPAKAASDPKNNTPQYFFKVITEKGGKTYFEDDDKTQREVVQEGNKHYFVNASGTKVYVKKDYYMADRNGYPKFYILKASLQENIPHLYSPIILRLAEMYLNRAEANAKLGNIQEALNDVNVIRRRAGIPIYTSVPTGMTILDVVLKERRLELAFEGQRKFDIFRNGHTLNRKYPGTHLSKDRLMYEVSPTSNSIIQYIPESQIVAQPNLVQNPD